MTPQVLRVFMGGGLCVHGSKFYFKFERYSVCQLLFHGYTNAQVQAQYMDILWFLMKEDILRLLFTWITDYSGGIAEKRSFTIAEVHFEYHA